MGMTTDEQYNRLVGIDKADKSSVVSVLSHNIIVTSD